MIDRFHCSIFLVSVLSKWFDCFGLSVSKVAYLDGRGTQAHLMTFITKSNCPKMSINLVISCLPRDSRHLISRNSLSRDVCLPISSIFPGKCNKKVPLNEKNNGRPSAMIWSILSIRICADILRRLIDKLGQQGRWFDVISLRNELKETSCSALVSNIANGS